MNMATDYYLFKCKSCHRAFVKKSESPVTCDDCDRKTSRLGTIDVS